MYQKILAKLRSKFPGLPANILGLVAKSMESKVTEEDQIEGAIAKLDELPISLTDYAKFLQTESDRRVTEALKKKPVKTPEDEEEEEEETDPAAQKPKKKAGPSKLEQQMQALTEQMQNFMKQGAVQTNKSKLEAKMKAAGIPLQLLRGVTVEKEEDIETAFAEIETSFAEMKQELLNGGLAVHTPPVGGVIVGGGDGKVNFKEIDADIDAWAAKGKTTQTQV